ncbi:hypothetical protein TrCOL_g13243 [Triparma columacea]|uniref:EGF-like domain-containing protein n=1 Tax=Triparma columacea TaxID=722753 RepID=A0A9W7L6N1_9STRA|nr:hypothetical protein TrCOL_g13243 [Triparma columacea]
MLFTYNLYGEIICTLDDASCVLDGEDGRRLIWLDGTGSGSLTLRALTFYKGSASADYGGGVYVKAGSVIIQLCVFSSCNSIENWTIFGYSYGGGGLFVMEGSGTTTVDFYGTSFSGNGANSNNGDDIYRHAGTVTIHNTCPSPYSSGSPTKGSALDTYGTVGGTKFSYTECSGQPCVASSSSSDDGTDGNFYCINGGDIGGTFVPGQSFCTCTSCDSNYRGTNCATCAVAGYSGPTCTADPCVATSTSTDDGTDGNFYCINGGSIGGNTGSCTCTSCNMGSEGVNCATCTAQFTGSDCATCIAGYSGSDCTTADPCVATSTSTDDGTDGNFYCINGGSIGGNTGSCTCTGCDGYSGLNCQTADPCRAVSNTAADGSDGDFYCINGGR